MRFRDLPNLTAKDKYRFLSKVPQNVPVTECWIWLGTCEGKYGKFFIQGSEYKAHRVAFMVWNDRKPNPNLDVCHKCDTPMCINPHHLFEGTRAENLQDCIRKGRQGDRSKAKGDASPYVKLSDAQVAEIRQRYVRWKVTQPALAAEYGVARSLIHRIVSNQARVK